MASPPHMYSIVFASWRECAHIGGHIGAARRIWLNLWCLRPTGVHNPNAKWIGSAVFAQLTAECRRVSYIDASRRIRLKLYTLARNMIKRALQMVYASPQPKREVDRFSRFCTAHRWMSSATLGPPGEYGWNCAHGWTCASIGLPDFTVQMANRSVQPFLHSSRQKVSILYNWCLFSRKLHLLTRDEDPI